MFIYWLIKKIKAAIRRRRIRKNLYRFDTIEEIDYLEDGLSFEEYMACLLEEAGYEYVDVTPKSRDFGADLIITDAGIKYAVQCKYYSRPVGVEAVAQVYAAKAYYKCHLAIVLTNNVFTSSAEDLAEACDVILWDRFKIKELIDNINISKKYHKRKRA